MHYHLSIDEDVICALSKLCLCRHVCVLIHYTIIIHVSDTQCLKSRSQFPSKRHIAVDDGKNSRNELSCLLSNVTLSHRRYYTFSTIKYSQVNARYVSRAFVVPSSRDRIVANQSLGRPSHEFLVTGSSKFSSRNQCGDSVRPSPDSALLPALTRAPTVFLFSHLLEHDRSLLVVTSKAVRTRRRGSGTVRYYY